MNIYYFIHLTGTDIGISGIPRVVKNLGRELCSRSNLNLVPVCWSRRLGAIVHAEQKLLDNFARHGGPRLQQSSQARQPIAPEPGEWLLFAEAPHLHSYDHEYPSISIDEPIGYARRFGLKVAALIHDLLPLTHQNGRVGRRMFVDMAADGGRSDGSELERLRVTVYAHALALCDIVLPVSRTTGDLLTKWLIEHGRRAELLPPITPVLLPEEVVGAPRAIPQAMSAPEGSPTEFLAVGTVSAHKNQLAAMSAFQRLAERRPDLNIRFHVVGAVTPDAAVPASLIAKRARGRIILHGHLPDDELAALTSQVRASVFVSLAEGYGLPVAESLWRGKPCLCSGEGSIAEIAQGGGCLQVDPRSLDEIEAGFETLATDGSRYSELTHEIAARRMKSWKEYADEIIEKLIAPSLEGAMRPEAPEGLVESAQTSLFSEQTVAGATSDDRGADEGSRQAIFMVSASDLTVHQAYRSGRARSIYYNSAIRYDRAQDGAVPQKTLFFGPYAQLPAGRYAFRFDGEIDGKLDLAFTANSGARQIARFEVTSFAEPVVVELSAPVEKFEIVGAKTPTLKHLVLRCAFAEFRGSPASADDEAAAQRNAESDAEAGKGPEPAPSGSAAIAEAEQEGPSAQPEAAPRAEDLAPARDADGNALSLPFALPADKLFVHDAYGAGPQNRLRAGRTISFDSDTHADVAELRLFYGPYLHLEPGEYSFQFRGALNGSLKLRFTKAFGAECLREVVVTGFDVPVEVAVETAAEQFEIIGERLENTKAMTLASIELSVQPPTSGPKRPSDANQPPVTAATDPEPDAPAESAGPAATPAEPAPRAEGPVYVRDDDGNGLSLLFVLEADGMSVHDAYGAGSQNRLRVGSTISFEAMRDADVVETVLFFGPYLRLEPGDYSFRFRGTLEGALSLRFTKRFAAECLREVVVTGFDVPVEVAVETAAEQFEIIGERLKNTKAMTLASIELSVYRRPPAPKWRPSRRPARFEQPWDLICAITPNAQPCATP